MDTPTMGTQKVSTAHRCDTHVLSVFNRSSRDAMASAERRMSTYEKRMSAESRTKVDMTLKRPNILLMVMSPQGRWMRSG